MSAREELFRRVAAVVDEARANKLIDDVIAEALAQTELAADLAEEDYQRIVRGACQLEEKLRARIAELEAAAEKVAEFCAARAEYVDNINNCSPSNDRDYWRWNGHAEARRQLSQLLGLPVGWPAENKPVPVPQQRRPEDLDDDGPSDCIAIPDDWRTRCQPEDPHDGPNHHDYALGRDLPFIPQQVTGRCPKGHTFEDCTCGGAA